ncbi:MAG: ketoacyl-ACP synthase III [Clostridiales bacterium]|nr:ketoacyl-ACP synthase III [Clostridiales bacterium]
MKNAKIAAFASHSPEKVVSNEELSRLVDTTDEWIQTRSGIRSRRISSSESENSSGLATQVALALFEKSGVKPEEIDAIVVTTVTPDMNTPSTAALVQRNIGAVNAGMCFDVNAACAGFVYGMSVGEKLISSGKHKKVLVLSAEVLSKATDWLDRSTCVLLADGAGGVLLTEGDEKSFLAEDFKSDGNKIDILHGGNFHVSNPWCEAPQDFKLYIRMKGREVFDFALKEMTKSINRLIEEAKASVNDVKYFVVHQANARIIQAAAKKLGVAQDRFYVNMHEYGNTSSASIPIALSDMIKKGLIKSETGDKIVISGFGAGMTVGSMLIAL